MVVLCPPNDNMTWNQAISLFMRQVLSYGSYSNEEVMDYLSFFAEHITPLFGPPPSYQDIQGQKLTPSWRSFMTYDFTPVEMSLTWKNHTTGEPAVRYTVDIAPSLEGHRASIFERAFQALSDLEILSRHDFSIELDIDHNMWFEITKAMEVHELETHSECTKCPESAVFLGFDLAHQSVKGKVYWIMPICQSSVEHVDLLERVFTDCSNLFLKLASFRIAWNTIRDYHSSHIGTINPCFIGMDRTKSHWPRIKFYVRCTMKQSNFEEVWRHLTLGGHVQGPSGFKSTASSLWRSLMGSQPRNKPCVCLMYYEVPLEPGAIRAPISSKLYIPVFETPHPDSYVAQKVLAHCPSVRDAPFLRFLSSQGSGTAFFTYVALAPGPQSYCTDLTLYLNPSIFSTDKWTEKDGVFHKALNSP